MLGSRLDISALLVAINRDIFFSRVEEFSTINSVTLGGAHKITQYQNFKNHFYLKI